MMKRRFKLIGTMILSGILLMSSSFPTMAAEQNQAVSEATTEDRASTLYATYYYEGSIKAGNKLSPVVITKGQPSLIKYKISGSGGNVIIRLKNRDNNDQRDFTAVANNQWDTARYLSPMTTGTWDVSVVFASGSGHDKIWMEFYK